MEPSPRTNRPAPLVSMSSHASASTGNETSGPRNPILLTGGPLSAGGPLSVSENSRSTEYGSPGSVAHTEAFGGSPNSTLERDFGGSATNSESTRESRHFGVTIIIQSAWRSYRSRIQFHDRQRRAEALNTVRILQERCAILQALARGRIAFRKTRVMRFMSALLKIQRAWRCCAARTAVSQKRSSARQNHQVHVILNDHANVVQAFSHKSPLGARRLQSAAPVLQRWWRCCSARRSVQLKKKKVYSTLAHEDQVDNVVQLQNFCRGVVSLLRTIHKAKVGTERDVIMYGRISRFILSIVCKARARQEKRLFGLKLYRLGVQPPSTLRKDVYYHQRSQQQHQDQVQTTVEHRRRKPLSWSVYSQGPDPHLERESNPDQGEWKEFKDDQLALWSSAIQKYHTRAVRQFQRWWRGCMQDTCLRARFALLSMARKEGKTRQMLEREAMTDTEDIFRDNVKLLEDHGRRELIELRQQPACTFSDRLAIEDEESCARQYSLEGQFASSLAALRVVLHLYQLSHDHLSQQSLLYKEQELAHQIMSLNFLLPLLAEMKRNFLLESHSTIVGVYRHNEMVIDGQPAVVNGQTVVSPKHSTSTRKLRSGESALKKIQRLQKEMFKIEDEAEKGRAAIEIQRNLGLEDLEAKRNQSQANAEFQSRTRIRREEQIVRCRSLGMESNVRAGGYTAPTLLPMFNKDGSPREDPAQLADQISAQGSSFLRTAVHVIKQHHAATKDLQHDKEQRAHREKQNRYRGKYCQEHSPVATSRSVTSAGCFVPMVESRGGSSSSSSDKERIRPPTAPSRTSSSSNNAPVRSTLKPRKK